MWGNKNNAVKSTFWQGNSITSKSLTSYFGKFLEILTTLFHNEEPNTICLKLTIPKVIVIGNESSGKSSLLENIIKCPIFPRNSSICTRQPIHVILRTVINSEKILCKITYKGKDEIISDKNQIIIKIQEIMNEIPIDEISNEEIHIEIHDMNLPNFEFYDLPGIRAYPENIAIKTVKLTEFYLQQPNTIVLCVVPSTTPRITSYLPIALIKKYKKEENSIIALSMADRVGQNNIYELLIKRITNNTDEFDYNEYAGCVAIINRSHLDNTNLEDNDVFSHEWFLLNIINNIPHDFSKKNIELIKQNIGIENLINNLDNLYNKFIKNNWIPSTLRDLNKKIKKLEVKINNIGLPVDEINKEDLLKIYGEIIYDFTNRQYNVHDRMIINEYYNSDIKMDDFISELSHNILTLDKLYSGTNNLHDKYYLPLFKKYNSRKFLNELMNLSDIKILRFDELNKKIYDIMIDFMILLLKSELQKIIPFCIAADFKNDNNYDFLLFRRGSHGSVWYQTYDENHHYYDNDNENENEEDEEEEEAEEEAEEEGEEEEEEEEKEEEDEFGEKDDDIEKEEKTGKDKKDLNSYYIKNMVKLCWEKTRINIINKIELLNEFNYLVESDNIINNRNLLLSELEYTKNAILKIKNLELQMI